MTTELLSICTAREDSGQDCHFIVADALTIRSIFAWQRTAELPRRDGPLVLLSN
jgi:hypothetical protein